MTLRFVSSGTRMVRVGQPLAMLLIYFRQMMPLLTAKRYSTRIIEWLAPYCQRIEIAGSVRREAEKCNDVDVVCIASGNHLWEFLKDYVQNSNGRARWENPV